MFNTRSESIIQHHGNSSNKWLRGANGWISIPANEWLTMGANTWPSIGANYWLIIPCPMTNLLLFSPFVHFTFARINREREKRVDERAVNYLNNSISLSSALLKTAKMMRKEKSSLPMTQSFLTQKFLKPKRALTERIEALMALPERKNDNLPWSKRILIGIGIALLLYPQIFLHIRVFSYMLQIF